MFKKANSLDCILVKLCLYKIRQIKLCIAKQDPEKIYQSLNREEKLIYGIEPVNSLSYRQKALYAYYQILEKRLLNLLEKEKDHIKLELLEHKLRGYFKIE